MKSYIGDEKTGTERKVKEWPTVEAERDYWKKLALAYGAKISAMKHVLGRTWTVELDHQGNQFITEVARNDKDVQSPTE